MFTIQNNKKTKQTREKEKDIRDESRHGSAGSQVSLAVQVYRTSWASQMAKNDAALI